MFDITDHLDFASQGLADGRRVVAASSLSQLDDDIATCVRVLTFLHGAAPFAGDENELNAFQAYWNARMQEELPALIKGRHSKRSASK